MTSGAPQAGGVGESIPNGPCRGEGQHQPSQANAPIGLPSHLPQPQQQPRASCQEQAATSSKGGHGECATPHCSRQRSRQQGRIQQPTRHECPCKTQRSWRTATRCLQLAFDTPPNLLPQTVNPIRLTTLDQQPRSQQESRNMQCRPQRPQHRSVAPHPGKSLHGTRNHRPQNRISKQTPKLKQKQRTHGLRSRHATDASACRATHGHAMRASNDPHNKRRHHHGNFLHGGTLPGLSV